MSGIGGGQQSTQQPTLPPIEQPIFGASAGSWLEGLNASANSPTSILNQLKPNPEQIAQLTPAELQNINQLEGFAKTGAPGEQQGFNLLKGLTSGPIGSSPDTLAAMRAYTQNVEPTIESSLAATGGGRGGELTAALQQGQTSAYAPLVQQEVQNRLAAVPLYSQLAAQRSGDVTTAMNASDMQRQVQQAGFSSQFQDFLRRAGLSDKLQLGPFEALGPALLGGTSVSTPGKF